MVLKLAKQRKKQILITSEFWYDLFLGGYIHPGDFLDDASAKKVRDAVATINEFETLLEDSGILEHT